jgi:hypothetical protein
MGWILITKKSQMCDIPQGAHLDFTQAKFGLDAFPYTNERIAAIRVPSSQCSLTTMITFLSWNTAISCLEVDTHLPDKTRHRTMRSPTCRKVLKHEDTLGLRMDCAASGDGKWNCEHVTAEECFAQAIIRDVNREGVQSLTLKPTQHYDADFVRRTVLDQLCAGLFPNLTRLTISVCAKHASQVTIPGTVRQLHIFLANNGKDETALSAPNVTHLSVEPRGKQIPPVSWNTFSADCFGALLELEIKYVNLRLTLPLPCDLRDVIVGAWSSFQPISGGFSGQHDNLSTIRFQSTDVAMSQILQLTSFAPGVTVKVRCCDFTDLPGVDIRSTIKHEDSSDESDAE